MNLLDLTYPQCAHHLRLRYGGGAYHAAALYRAFYRTPDLDVARLPAFAASPSLAKLVSRDLQVKGLPIVRQACEEGVTKLVFALADGLEIETVVIPMANHTTICISCQAGCRMGCRFCETGQMGLQRSLTAAEIVSQVYAVKVRMGLDVRNVVFMGMGEPLDNFDNVIQAVGVLQDQRGLDIAPRHITLSTVGLARGIERLAAMGPWRLKLAVSVNAPDDRLRSSLMPINQKYPLASLKNALRQYPLAKGDVFFMEYVLIKGINDHPRYAARLAAWLEDLPVRLNLIAYNSHSRSPFEAPGTEDIQRFHRALIDQGIFVRLRASKGAGICAACGQLGGAGNFLLP